MAAAGITNFGPYVWDTKVPRWKLEEGKLNPSFTGWTQDDCVDRPIYEAEMNTVKDEKGSKSSLVGVRRERGIAQVFGITRGVVEKIMEHDDGRTPRPFVSLANEDATTKSKGHTVERHILGMGEMAGPRQVAMRAAFQRVNGKKMVLDDTGRASVFKDEATANAAVQAWLAADFLPNWRATHAQARQGHPGQVHRAGQHAGGRLHQA